MTPGCRGAHVWGGQGFGVEDVEFERSDWVSGGTHCNAGGIRGSVGFNGIFGYKASLRSAGPEDALVQEERKKRNFRYAGGDN